MTNKSPLRKAFAAAVFALALPACAFELTARPSGVEASPAAVASAASQGTAAGKRGKQRRKRARRRRARGAALPPARLMPQIMAPSPRPPIVRQPSLPVTPTIQADPMLMPPDTREIPYGDPAARKTESKPEAGAGRGTGPGYGYGIGPGRGENTGGGGGTGSPPRSVAEDGSTVYTPREVTQKAVILSKPDPGYTEEARKNQVQGTVRVRAVLTASGRVTNISVIKGLPDGLSQKTVEAARRVLFRPAQKDGRAVSQWIVLEYNFNIY
ncbi:MAG TPA: TonB family protein [Pyrinomonadaceae bacterium]|nr:TonB family protein [Pyrinomonadaceae bacterium]